MSSLVQFCTRWKASSLSKAHDGSPLTSFRKKKELKKWNLFCSSVERLFFKYLQIHHIPFEKKMVKQLSRITKLTTFKLKDGEEYKWWDNKDLVYAWMRDKMRVNTKHCFINGIHGKLQFLQSYLLDIKVNDIVIDGSLWL